MFFKTMAKVAIDYRFHRTIFSSLKVQYKSILLGTYIQEYWQSYKLDSNRNNICSSRILKYQSVP
jgi:hypothetical protein